MMASANVRMWPRSPLDRADDRDHVGVAKSQRERFAIERVTDVQQRRRNAGFARCRGDQPIVLQHIDDRAFDPPRKTREAPPNQAGSSYGSLLSASSA